MFWGRSFIENSILEIKNLSVSFGQTQAVREVSLSLARNSFTALVGESGSGKSVTALSVTRLVTPSGLSGQVFYDAGGGSPVDLLSLGDHELLRVRGGQIAYIFQDSSSSLNPVMRSGHQIREAFLAHFDASAAEAKNQAIRALVSVKFREPERVYESFPHELSGGMRQRVAIAMALIMSPRILLADEPTAALDTANEEGIMELLSSIRRERSLTVLFITHNISLAARHADTIYAMQEGRVVETLARSGGTFLPKDDYAKRLFSADLSQWAQKSFIPCC